MRIDRFDARLSTALRNTRLHRKAQEVGSPGDAKLGFDEAAVVGDGLVAEAQRRRDLF
jgi:hypothetical protein